MNMIKIIGSSSLSSLALAIAIPTLSMAETGQAGVFSSNVSHNMVHRVVHSLADEQVYSSGSVSGNKWESGIDRNRAQSEWTDSSLARSGFKWGDTNVIQPQSPSYAGSPTYEWGVRSFSEQAGNKWQIRNYAEQAGNKWQIRNYAEQAGNKWQIRNYAEQAGNKWQIR